MKVVTAGVLITSSLLAALFAAQPAQAGPLEDGIQAYNAGNYSKARPLFEKAVAETPNNWQAHYYLANTYLGLGKYAGAKYEYTACQRVANNPAVKQRCQNGLEQVAKRSGSSSSSSSGNTGGGGSSASDDKDGDKDADKKVASDEVKSEATSKAQSEVTKKRDQIMKKAKEECAVIMKAAKQQIEDEKENSNQRFRYEDGSRGLDIPEERQKEIMGEAEQKCKKIMEEAERTARTYR